jgi:hypothetical protein
MIRRFLRGPAAPASANGSAAPAFADDPEYFHRLDWRLLQNGAVALYYRSQVLAEDQAALLRAGYRAYELDATTWREAAAFHEDVRRVLRFPEYYRKNLAAFVDCLGDLEVARTGGALLVMRGYDAFTRAQPELAQAILDAIETTSRRFLLLGRRLLALVQSDDPRIRFERVGANPVNWNPREWSDADRGLRRGS